MLIADSGFFLALVRRRDPWHERAVEAYRSLGEGLATTWPVITETAYLIGSRLGETYRLRFLEQILSGAVSVFELRLEHGPRLLDLTRRYAALPMDLADASLVILAEHLGHGRILSTDMRDFETYRWKNHHPFKNLLIPEA